MPNQKLGIEMPKKPKNDPRLSAQELGFAPAQTPSGSPRATAIRRETTASSIVAGSALADHGDDRIGIAERRAEVALEHVDEKPQILNVKRLVQAPPVAGFSNVLRRGLIGQ